jgi:hypothetical protein
MGEIVGSEVGRRFSPGFASISILPARRRRLPRWVWPATVLLAAVVALLLYLGR